MHNKTVIYLYNRFHDPLIQGNIYLYIEKIAKKFSESNEFAFITFEDPSIPIPETEIKKIKDDLKLLNIYWYPCKWHKGTSLTFKILDFFNGIVIILKLRFKGYNAIISLASVAGSFAYIISKIFRMNLYLYQYEPHSEYEVDSGRYTDKSIKFKILNYLERRSAMSAKTISSGTKHMLGRLAGWNVKAKVFKIPSVVNEKKFYYSPDERIAIREKHGIPLDKYILFYPGKFGGLYYADETVRMFEVLLVLDSKFHALIVTPNDILEVENLFVKARISKDRYTLAKSEYNDIHRYYSASDFGIIAVPPGPSKKFVSNIKVGEYLCSGIPYLICKGISEDDDYAIENNVGVVISDFSREEIVRSYIFIKKFMDEDRVEQRNRCRKVGIEYRGFDKLSAEFEKAFNSLHTP